MTNDTTTLNGALQELGETLAANLTTQGVTSSASEGLTTLAEKILDIQGGGGSNIVVFENQGTTFNYTRKRSSDGFTVNIPSGVTTLGQYCFYYCYGLKDVNFPSTITTIDIYAFYYCTGLTSVTVPSGVTSIGQSGFGYCSNLSSITLPSTCQSIGDYCFSNCTSLTEVVLPEGLKTINSYAFQGCSNLETVHIPSTVTSLANYAFYSDTIDDYELYWDTSSSIITYSSSKMPTSTNTKFTVPVGTYDLYVAKGYPSDKIVERMKIEFSQDSYVATSGSVTLTATLTEGGVGVSGATVTLSDGSTTTTATTNSNGVATFNLTGISSQTTFTATYEDVSDSCIVYTTHDYSIAFSQSSYITIAGEATLEITLLDHGSGVSGATVSVVGSDSSSYSGITNSSGVASVTVTNISTDTTFTVTYSNVSDTCTVSFVNYLINDDASADNKSTLFGNSISLRNSGSNSIAWNSSGYYTITTQSSSSKESFRVLSDLTGITGDFVIEWDGYAQDSEGTDGLVIYNSSTAWLKITDNIYNKEWWYGYNNGSFHEVKFYGSINTSQKWVHYKVTVQGSTMSVEATYEGSTVATHSETIHFTRSSSTQYGFNSEWSSNKVTRYKNIVAYPI